LSSTDANAVKSNKQRRAEIQARRKVRAKEEAARQASKRRGLTELDVTQLAPVDASKLVPYNSYVDPEFVSRGFYLDQAFICQGCGAEQVWTARQQKWWYEIAKGSVWSIARLCRPCRRRERESRAAAQRRPT